MLTAVAPKIDAGQGRLKQPKHRLGHGFRLAHKRENGAVMVGIGLDIEEEDVGNGADGLGLGRDRLPIPAFGNVRDALNKLSRHRAPPR